MEFTSPVPDIEADHRQHLAAPSARVPTPKIPATTHRHLLSLRLRMLADRLDS